MKLVFCAGQEGFFPGDLFKGIGQASNEHQYTCTLAMWWPDHLPGKKVTSSPVPARSWSEALGTKGLVVSSVAAFLPTGPKAWVAPLLYAAQQSFDNRV